MGVLAANHSREKRRVLIPMSTAASIAELKRNYVRPYVRTSTHKLRWTKDLHQSFMDAVTLLGGKDKATPKQILALMKRDDVTIAHVKSHLQMYRQDKINAEGMPVNADDPVLFKPISKALSRISPEQQKDELSPGAPRDEVYMALQLLKEGKITEVQNFLIRRMPDYQRYATMAPEGDTKSEDVKPREFITEVVSPTERKRKAEDVQTHEFITEVVSHTEKKRKAEDNVELDLSLAPTSLSCPSIRSPRLRLPSPSTAEEATLSLGLFVDH
ncbi:hypothetical protein KC19_7G114400 [Ceratodon purpureus]|uniref:HTH myb-type domain-containing protein n=1 Tax=Ceratodon purpureus TaxID=3225 RepID=A0A8T0H5C1_CERPU|nr:hypothetical protein KC19_7G114400 [Ceratodon purpureus]